MFWFQHFCKQSGDSGSRLRGVLYIAALGMKQLDGLLAELSLLSKCCFGRFSL